MKVYLKGGLYEALTTIRRFIKIRAGWGLQSYETKHHVAQRKDKPRESDFITFTMCFLTLQPEIAQI